MRPPKFIPTCDSILTPNVASTLQWKRRRIRRVAWYAEDDFNVNPTSSLSCHVSCADFFRRRALFLPLTRRPQQKGRAGGSPTGVFVAWRNVGTFVRLCFGVSCGIARTRSFVCDRGCGCVASVVAVAVSPWASHPPCRAVAVAVVSVVFSSPSCGCDTPTNASVCSGLCGVYVDSICTTYVGRV